MVDAFFGIPGFPRLQDAAVVRKALARGVAEGLFAYSGRGEPPLSEQFGERGPIYQIALDRIVIGRPLADDEIDLDDGFLILPQALPAPPEPVLGPAQGPGPVTPTPIPPEPGPTPPQPGGLPPLPAPLQTTIRLTLTMTRQQLYASFGAIGNLVEQAGQVKLTIEVTNTAGFDQVWLRNAVYEPLEEAGIEPNAGLNINPVFPVHPCCFFAPSRNYI